jgi:hypothetical protein
VTPVYVAKRRFDHGAGERWEGYVSWSGLSQLREVVSLDGMLCPTVPDTLVPDDWKYNVHADYQTSYFSSLAYLQARTSNESDLNLLAILQNPSPSDLATGSLPGFIFAGFDLMDVHGDISALTNCGGFEGVFANAELSDVGLVGDLGRAYEIQRDLRSLYPAESHAQCHVWGIWRLTDPGAANRA